MSAPSAARIEAEQRIRLTLEQALVRSFHEALHADPMPVMAALEAAARTVGRLYRQAAALHRSGACGCGWQPDTEADIPVLEAMLAAAADPGGAAATGYGLADMPPAGRA